MLQGTDVWDEDDTSAGMVARLIDQHRELAAIAKNRRKVNEEKDERIRKAIAALNPPPF